MRYAWSFEEVDRRLKDIMTTIFHNAYDASVECGVPRRSGGGRQHRRL